MSPQSWFRTRRWAKRRSVRPLKVENGQVSDSIETKWRRQSANLIHKECAERRGGQPNGPMTCSQRLANQFQPFVFYHFLRIKDWAKVILRHSFPPLSPPRRFTDSFGTAASSLVFRAACSCKTGHRVDGQKSSGRTGRTFHGRMNGCNPIGH